eukprot:722880-Rhodomonas_salina.2
MSATDPAYVLRGVRVSLRPCYAMSGTDLACGTTAMSGMEMVIACLRMVLLLSAYAICGTDLAYGATAGRPFDHCSRPRCVEVNLSAVFKSF